MDLIKLDNYYNACCSSNLPQAKIIRDLLDEHLYPSFIRTLFMSKSKKFHAFVIPDKK